ncbi:hypothetical protein FVE67_03600 [Thermosulfurimonas marina]|uniref:Uncharacterized protein n=1 Tax=Thermosulfurimonas marina TaxID=2047767 RepID=A0A6H1WRT8_9BACT|nr:hypothetical protein [Thermosulfurimonas marina]QJA05937.1 hypothetical protein FVE67_03600 [Thermosulfurimonas marina]
MFFWWSIFLIWMGASRVWAAEGHEEGPSKVALITGLALLGLLASTATVGRLMIKGKASRRLHHLLAYLTLLLALVHAVYNLFLH